MLPMRLFTGNVFSVSSILAFVVGFAMLGSLTFLPTYLQYVRGVSATSSGIRTLPMVIGLLATSILAGTIVSRTGRYRVFPIAGAAVMALGLFLLSRLDEHTSVLLQSLYMLVLGAGIGLCMQVLVIVVQNTVEYSDLGVATSGITFFRTLGSSFGAATFGAIYANTLSGHLMTALTELPGVDPRSIASPRAVHALPIEQRAPIVHAYAETIQTLFLCTIPVAILALLLALALKQVPLRDSAKAGAKDLGDGFGLPDAPDSERELERVIARVLRSDGRAAAPGVLASSGTVLSEAETWAVAQIRLRGQFQGHVGLADIARAHRVPSSILEPAFTDTVTAGYVQSVGENLVLTALGETEFAKITDAWKAWLLTKLPDPGTGSPSADALDEALTRIAIRVGEQEQLALAAR
jgi:MFS family permease